MTPLPVISCEGCGACCTRVGTPPGLFAAFASPHWDGAFLADSEDYATWVAMPPEARNELAAYYAARARGDVPDRTADGETPCLWYEADARRCKNYDHRPQTCREFQAGGADCLRFRAEAD